MLHITATGKNRGACPRQAQIKPNLNYESHISPLSLPLSGVVLPAQGARFSQPVSNVLPNKP